MKIIDLLVWSSPARIDWKATEQEVRLFVIHKDPTGAPHLWALNVEATMKDVRRFAKTCGVAKLYAYRNQQLSSDFNLRNVELR